MTAYPFLFRREYWLHTGASCIFLRFSIFSFFLSADHSVICSLSQSMHHVHCFLGTRHHHHNFFLFSADPAFSPLLIYSYSFLPSFLPTSCSQNLSCNRSVLIEKEIAIFNWNYPPQYLLVLTGRRFRNVSYQNPFLQHILYVFINSCGLVQGK